MVEIKVEQVFVVEGQSFDTRKEAEEHLARVKLHKNVDEAVKNLISHLTSPDDVIDLVIQHIIKDRVEVRKILNEISGWEDNKIEPAYYDGLKKLIKEQYEKHTADNPPAPAPISYPGIHPSYPFHRVGSGLEVWCGGVGHASDNAWARAVEGMNDPK